MNPAVRRLAIIFLGLFVALNAAMMVWQVGWVWPQKRCEAERKWWDGSQRVCAQPVLISDITGRVIVDEEARAAAKAAVGRAETPRP